MVVNCNCVQCTLRPKIKIAIENQLKSMIEMSGKREINKEVANKRNREAFRGFVRSL